MNIHRTDGSVQSLPDNTPAIFLMTLAAREKCTIDFSDFENLRFLPKETQEVANG